jgi:ubiquinol-cytochrome c reductase cytochrome b subunit
VKRLWAFLDDRLGFSSAIVPIVTHPVPRDVNWWYVFGSASLVAFMMQVITGVALAFIYVAAPSAAYDSIQFITNQQVLGSVVRGIHNFGASAMVILVGIHAIQVFLMGVYKFPREMTWVVGLLLLALTLAMAFTGQLLRYDQDGYWSVFVFSEMVGRVPVVGWPLVQALIAGQTVGGATLTRFYALHVFVIPALLFLFIGTHLYLVLKHGISEMPRAGVPVDPRTYRARYHKLVENGIPFWPDAAWKDMVFTCAVGVVVVALAIFVGPPTLNGPADPTQINTNPRPDWYFSWIFAVLALMPPWLENYVIVGGPVLLGVFLLALPFVAPAGERAPSRRPWAIAAIGALLLAMATLTPLGMQSPWSPIIDIGPLPPSVGEGLSGSALQGVTVFQTKGCHSCHQINGSGGLKGPELTYVADRLTPADITIRIIAGRRDMPAFGGNITTDELTQVVDFLSTRKMP